MRPVKGITDIILVPSIHVEVLLDDLDESIRRLENFEGGVPRSLHAREKLQLSCSGIERNK